MIQILMSFHRYFITKFNRFKIKQKYIILNYFSMELMVQNYNCVEQCVYVRSTVTVPPQNEMHINLHTGHRHCQGLGIIESSIL